MTKLEKEFYEALKESIGPGSERFFDPGMDRPYFSGDYRTILKKYMSPGYNGKLREDINAVASSARLCALDFYKCPGAVLEKTLSNDLVNSMPTFMDAAVGDIYYECKCQEILKTSHGTLKGRYKESRLFGELMGRGLDACTGDPLRFSVRALGIDSDKDYHLFHFDIKQLICHLIAIANNNKDRETMLQYIIYRPSQEAIDKRPKLQKLYEDLEGEIDAIWMSKNRITDFCRKKKIKLAAPVYKSINHIKDEVLEELKKGSR